MVPSGGLLFQWIGFYSNKQDLWLDIVVSGYKSI
jgi:hypothetical protein